MTGAGNDFIVIDNRFYHFTDAELSDLARRWCPRRFGVGADGLLAFCAPAASGPLFRMQYFNADGSFAPMCGNGARCMARFARLSGLDVEEMTFETGAGIYRAHVPADPSAPVRLFLPPPTDFAPHLAMHSAPAREPGEAHFIRTGTPHVVCFVEDVTGIPVDRWGAAIRYDTAMAPHGTNVNFAQCLADGARMSLRTYERGVEAETLACGTGATAAALIARRLGYLEADEVTVSMPGGTLTIGWTGAEMREPYMEGPADVVFRGTLEV